MLGALVMVVRCPRPGGIEDHLPLDRPGSKQRGGHQIDSLARIVHRRKRRLQSPVDTAKLERRPEIRIEPAGVGHTAVEHDRAIVRGQITRRARRQKYDMGSRQLVASRSAIQDGRASEQLEPRQIRIGDVDACRRAAVQGPPIEPNAVIADAFRGDQGLAHDAVVHLYSIHAVAVEQNRHGALPDPQQGAGIIADLTPAADLVSRPARLILCR